jgi:hypothetical protein
MTEAATTPLQREEDALLSIQNALALFPVTKRSPSHCTISTAPTVSSSRSSSRSVESDQGSWDGSNDDADSSEQTIGGFYIEQAVINSIAETLSSQDAPEHKRPETALEIINDEIVYSSYLSHAVDDEAAPSGSLLSQMFFTCMGESVFSTSIEPQSTDGQDTLKSMSGSFNRLVRDYRSTMEHHFAFCGTQREPPSTGLTTNLSKSVSRRRCASKGRWKRRFSQNSDNDDASRRTDKTDKTEKRCNTSKEKMASRGRSRTSKTPCSTR